MDLTETVRRCKEGDRNAFGLLYQATFESMRKVVLKYAEDQDMADDVLHDGYLVALTSIGSLKDPSKVEGWLAVIMKNLALQELKSRKVRAADDISGLEVADADADGAVDRRLSMEDLDRIMDDLPDGYGKVFRLSVLEGLSHKEIGERLGIAPNSSSSQLFRAKVMMRRLVWQHSQRLGVILAVAALIGVAWYVLVKVPPVEEPGSGVVGGLAKEGIATDTDEAEARMQEVGNDDSSEIPSVRSRSKSQTPLLAEVPIVSCLDPVVDEGKETVFSIPEDEDRQTESDAEGKGPGDISPKHSEHDGSSENFGFETMLKKSRAVRRGGWSVSVGCSETFAMDSPFSGVYDADFGPSWGDPCASVCPEPHHITVHKMPVVVELSVEKHFSPRFSLESGLRYTYLRTDYITKWQGLNMEADTQQKIHYLGLPLKLKFKLTDFSRFSIYLQGGGALDVPVYGVNRYLDYSGPPDVPFSDKTEHINASVQWSVEGGLGLQYRLAPHVGLYVEPSLKYYFDTHSGIETIRQENPLNVAIPVGIRFSW